MKCLIVDDEPLARQLIESYIARIDGLHLVKSCENAIEAFGIIQTKAIDILFLDIQMPQVTGIDLLRSLKKKPFVILTTAYREYAYDAFDLDVVDYLLKPIPFDRFLRSIDKTYQLKGTRTDTVEEMESVDTFNDAYIFFKQDREMIKVYLRDIQYIESLRDYVRVKTTTQQIITYQKISYLEQKLPENKFMRIHRSYIVPIDKITSFTSINLKLDAIDIPIGRNYKNEVMKILNRNNVLQKED